MMKEKSKDGKIVNRFKGKLIEMIKNTGSKFDDYSISHKIRVVFLHWSYELLIAIDEITFLLV